MAYATLVDLQKYAGEQSPDPGDERRLVRASKLVDLALASAYYTTDTDGNPTDATVLQAIKNAVCAQVVWWRKTDDEIGRGGQLQTNRVKPAVLVPTVASGRATGRLCPEAWEALMGVKGLIRHKPYAW